MRKLVILTSLTLLAILLIGLISWFYAGEILNNIVRPGIESLVSERLSGEAHIGNMSWTEEGIDIAELKITSPLLNGRIDHILLNFTPGSLWNRQLAKLQISNPQFEITPTQEQSSRNESFSFPATLPFRIAQLKLSDGALTLTTAGRQLHFHQLHLSGALEPLSPFTLSGFFGQGETHPIAVEGEVQFPQQSLSLKRITWQDRQLLREPLSFQLAGGTFDLSDSRAGLTHFDDQQLQNIFQLFDRSYPLPADLSFILDEISAGFSFAEGSLQLSIKVAGGRITWKDWNTHFTDFRMTLHQQARTWSFSGQFRGPALVESHFEGRLDNGNNLSGKSVIRIPRPGILAGEMTGRDLPGIYGAVVVTTDITLQDKRLEISPSFHVEKPAEEKTPEHPVDITGLSGSGNFLFLDERESFSLSIVQKSQPLFDASGDFDSFKATLAVAGLAQLEQFTDAAVFPAWLQEMGNFKLTGKIDKEQPEWVGRFEFKGDRLRTAGVLLTNLGGQTVCRYSDRKLTLHGTAFSGDVAYRETTSARLNIRSSADLDTDGFAITISEGRLSSLNYNAADGLSGIGAADVNLHGRIAGRWSSENIKLDLQGTLAVREILAGVFYADLSSYKADFSLAGEVDTSRQKLLAKKLAFNVPGIVNVTAQGEFDQEQVNANGRIAPAVLEESFGAHLKPLFQDLEPGLAKLNLNGRMTIDYRLHWQPDQWSVGGELAFHPLTVQWGGLINLVRGRGTLPVMLTSNSKALPAEAVNQRRGTFSFEHLKIASAVVENEEMNLLSSPNRIDIPTPVRFGLAGGHLKLSDFWYAWGSDQPQGALKIDVDEVELERLTSDLDLPRMQGSLSADLGTISYHDRQLSTDGIGRIEVFDGTFKFSNMSYSEPFTDRSTFHTDVDFNGLDLQQATRTFDFGEMNGILDGSVVGLQLYGVTPAAFKASVATRESGRRNISVKALNNLSVLSQGGVSAALSRGIYQFIDFYRYRKLAFDCSLVNDTFTLIGTARPDSQRYLVDGALLPPRINITISTPTISFKEMMNRLARIDRAGN